MIALRPDDFENRRFCSFGITEAIGIGIAAAVADVGAVGAAVGEGVADVAAGVGSLAAGAGSAIAGGISDIGAALGIGGDAAAGAGAAGDALGGAGTAAGAIDPVTGAALPAGTATQAATAGAAGAGTGGAGISAAGAAAPAGVPAAAAGGDVTAGAIGPAANYLGGTTASAIPGDVGAVSASNAGGAALADPAAISNVGDTFVPNAADSTVVNPLGGTGTGISAGDTPTIGGGAGGGFNQAVSTGVDNFGKFITGGNVTNLSGDLPSLSTVGTVLSGGELAAKVLGGQPNPPGYNNIESEAQKLQGQGANLTSYLHKGTLPPGVQQGLTQAGDAAKAAIRSQYASRGMSGSSAEQQDLANVDITLQTQGAQIATNLLQQGVSEENLAASLYGQLMNVSLEQDAELGNAITGFAVAASGGGLPIQRSAAA